MRRRNVIRAEELPYAMPTGMVYDQMTAYETLEQAAEKIGYAELREQQRQWRAEGRLVGIGMSLMVEPTAIAHGWMSTDAATVRIGPNGRVDVAHTGASHGQSLETTIAQVVADELGVDFEQVRVLQGDTDTTPFGPGTGGSRSAVITGGAARLAAREVRARMLAIVANQLEASEDDLEIVDGRVQVVGTPTKGMAIAEIAQQAYAAPAMLPPGAPLGLEAQVRYSPESFVTWSNACHMCVCEVDPATGAVEILRYLVSEDCGVMINPNVVEGQIAGGVVQGIGGVLYEHLAYDDAGNPLAGNVRRLSPADRDRSPGDRVRAHRDAGARRTRAATRDSVKVARSGLRPRLINAIADAIAPLGAKVRSQPLGPADIVALIEAASDDAV